MAGRTDLEQLVYQMSVNIDQLTKQQAKALAAVNDNAGAIQKRMDKTGASLFDKFVAPPKVGKALDQIFDSSRLKILDSGVARVGLFGSALETMGGAGIVAAGAIGALWLTMDKAEKATDFAATIAKTSKELGVSTTFLQQFNFAARQTDVPLDAADTALKKLNISLGLIQTNLTRNKILANAFADLGFSPEQLKAYQNAGELFPVLSDRIRAVGDAAQQAAIAKKLGISELLPLIQAGANGFRGLADQADKLGVVMNHALIEQGEAAHKKLQELDQVMQAKTNIAFVEFADTLVRIKTLFLEATEAGLAFLAKITGTQSVQSKINDLVAGEKGLLSHTDYATNPVAKALFARYHAQIEALLAERAKSAAAEAAADPKAAGYKPPVVGATAKAVQDHTSGLMATAEEDVDQARKTLAEAYKGLTRNIDKQAQFEIQANDDEAAAHQAKLKKDLESLLKDDTISGAQSDLAQAKIEEAQAATEAARIAKNQLIQRKADLADQEQWLKDKASVEGDYQSIRQIAASLAVTMAERREIELKLLASAQKAELAELEQQKSADDPTRASFWDEKIASTKDRQAAQLQQTIRGTAGPLEQWRNQSLATAEQVNEAYQNIAVQGLNSLTDGITGAITSTRSLGQAFSQVADQIISDLVRIYVQQQIVGPLASLLGLGLSPSLPGVGPVPEFYASGTDYASGGPAIVGEQGPELINLPRGATVTPNSELSRAMSSSSVSSNIVLNIDARGADRDGLNALQARLHAELPAIIVRTVADAQQRRLVR